MIGRSSASPRIVVLGAGGIGPATALLLRSLGDLAPHLYLVDREPAALREGAALCGGGGTRGALETVVASVTEPAGALEAICREADLILDCLPGSLAFDAARLALAHGTHYANLTEFVDQTERIARAAAGAPTAFALQCGLAPGFIDVLAMELVRRLEDRGVTVFENVEMRVGALGRHAVPPHHYGFTWSPEGVATEYLEPAVVVRDFQTTTLPGLSGRRTLVVDGGTYEEALTSGGAADLPQALEGRVRSLDYKTLRHPGHYAWVESLLPGLPEGSPAERARALEDRMKQSVPHIEDDEVVIYAAAEGFGPTSDGPALLRAEASYRIQPIEVAGVRLRAIQATTAAPLAEIARLLLAGGHRGVLTQSRVPPSELLAGPYVSAVYGPPPRSRRASGAVLAGETPIELLVPGDSSAAPSSQAAP